MKQFLAHKYIPVGLKPKLFSKDCATVPCITNLMAIIRTTVILINHKFSTN